MNDVSVKKTHVIEITKQDKKILISNNHAIYTNDMIYNFDYYHGGVEPKKEDGYYVVDYSKPQKHKTIGFDLFDIIYPSVSEPLASTILYLEFANLKEGDIVLDLGCYSGLTSILFSQKVGKSGKVISVDADVINYGFAKQNIDEYNKITGYNNIQLHHCAIWQYTGKLNFSVESNMGSAAVSIVGNRSTTMEVLCFTLNDFSEKADIEKLDFIKCDIEGSEAVIFDDDKFFSKFKPKIIVEPHNVDGHLSDIRCINALSQYGYSHKVIKQCNFSIPLITFRIIECL